MMMWLLVTLPGGFPLEDPLDKGGKISSSDSLGSIVGKLLPYALAIAGLILFAMLVFGGFTLLTSVGEPEKVSKGKQMIVYSLVGFLIIFGAIWIMQLLQVMLGLKLGF